MADCCPATRGRANADDSTMHVRSLRTCVRARAAENAISEMVFLEMAYISTRCRGNFLSTTSRFFSRSQPHAQTSTSAAFLYFFSFFLSFFPFFFFLLFSFSLFLLYRAENRALKTHRRNGRIRERGGERERERCRNHDTRTISQTIDSYFINEAADEGRRFDDDIARKRKALFRGWFDLELDRASKRATHQLDSSKCSGGSKKAID